MFSVLLSLRANSYFGSSLINAIPITCNYSRSHYHNSIIGLMSVNMKLLTIAHTSPPPDFVRGEPIKTHWERAFVHGTVKCNNFPW